MEKFKIESRYLKLCNVFRAAIRCIKAAFYRPDYQSLNVSVGQKTRPSICFETCGRAFETLTRAFETLGRAFKTCGCAFEDLREN